MGTITEEMRMMSLETRRNKVPANVRDDFMDMPYWEQLASDFGIRLPISGQVTTRAKLTKWLHRIGVTPKAYCTWVGYKSYSKAVALAGGLGLRSVAGMALEHRDLMLRLESVDCARRSGW